jgi:imidazolonepropionase
MSGGIVPELVIKNISELITLSSEHIDNSQPRRGQSLRELGIINNGAIAMSSGKIIAVGSTDEVLTELEIAPETKVINGEHKTVLPGFVDPHTHLIFSGTRENELTQKLEGKTYMEILKSGGGILKTVSATREATVDDLVKYGKSRLDTMLEYGTTTVEAKSGYGLTEAAELNSLRAIKELNKIHPIDTVATFLGAHARPPEYSDDPDKFIDLIISNMLPKIQSEKLAEFCDVFCEDGVFSIDQSRRLLLSAKEHGLKVRLHVDEFVPLGGAELAAELGAVSADHLMVSTDNGLKAMADKGVVGILLPGTPFALMEKHYPDARKMIELNVPIALATDFNPNCFTESMQFIISLACYNMKLLPAEAITASTINAAHAINRADSIGSLELGKQADIIVCNVPNYHHIPYHFGINHVQMVIKNGKIVVDKMK